MSYLFRIHMYLVLCMVMAFTSGDFLHQIFQVNATTVRVFFQLGLLLPQFLPAFSI